MTEAHERQHVKLSTPQGGFQDARLPERVERNHVSPSPLRLVSNKPPLCCHKSRATTIINIGPQKLFSTHECGMREIVYSNRTLLAPLVIVNATAVATPLLDWGPGPVH